MSNSECGVDRAVDILTISGCHWTMKHVNVPELKAKLSACLADVQAGETVVVCDRDTPIARIVPLENELDDLVVEEPTLPRSALNRLPVPRLRGHVDVVAVLREGRDQR
jgi:antitoxin (DNA-binding transcriptional repressor) of toxin-antitoxin stability system